jgi:hypothetical protein
MGLAASQARLLTITARKADCEFLSMNLSHQKLALSRNMEDVSSEYQKALNQTKLVYDYYGTGDSDMALNYGLLMNPSIYNDYYPKLVTDSKNRVILNSAYAAAARAAGIPAEGLLGTPSSDVRNAFIESLAHYGIITPTQAVGIEGITYNNSLGLGNGASASAGLTEITYDELLEFIKAQCVDTESWGLSLKDDAWDQYGENDDAGDLYLVKADKSGKVQSTESKDTAGLTLIDLLGDTQHTLGWLTQQGEQLPITGAQVLQDIVGGSDQNQGLLDWMCDQFGSILGGTAASDTALQYAYNAVFDLIYPNTRIDDKEDPIKNLIFKDRKDRADATNYKKGGSSYKEALDELAVKSTKDKANGNNSTIRNYQSSYAPDTAKYIGFTYHYNKETSDASWLWFNFHQDKKDKSQIDINLNNIAQAFLTSYVKYMEGMETSNLNWSKGKLSDCTMYDPEKSDFKFTIVTDTEVDTGDTQLYSNFYDTLFNQICLNGWTENAQIDDQEYMAEMLKSGMVYISSISDDGYYYQGNYTTDRNIIEVADEEAIAKAEAKYNTEKTKIENKEQTIDLKMKNLDTEISSLTTEYDTTKSLISKSIEKGFKRYEA